MRRLLWAAALTAVFSAGAWAADPGLYPGARLDPEITKKAQAAAPMGMGPSSVATTTDSFEKVMAFYKAAGTEVRIGQRPGQPDTGYERELPNSLKPGGPGSGIKVKQVMVILDGAPDLATSKNWVSITRPFIFNARPEGNKLIYEDIRDITAIIVSKQ